MITIPDPLQYKIAIYQYMDIYVYTELDHGFNRSIVKWVAVSYELCNDTSNYS